MNYKRLSVGITNLSLWDKPLREMTTDEITMLAGEVILAAVSTDLNDVGILSGTCLDGRPCPACFSTPDRIGDHDFRLLQCGMTGRGVFQLDGCPLGKWYYTEG